MLMRKTLNEICVVHLVRAQNGIGPLKDFLESYKPNPGGKEHDLIIIFKGFEREGPPQEYRLMLKPFKYKVLKVRDEGFDITAYFAVTRNFEYEYYCFLNSFSVILDAEWLLKMYQHITSEGVGVVGATGSYQSLFLGVDQWRSIIQKAIPKSRYPKLRRFWIGRLDWTVRYWLKGWWFRCYFSRFPNYHIRSNAFMVRNEVIKKIVCPKIRNKMDAYKCESGRTSITNQVIKLGKRVLVIGKDGLAYEKEDWWRSNTFRRDNQENLLISDNQTRAYASSELAQKVFLSYSAWGENSSPNHTNR